MCTQCDFPITIHTVYWAFGTLFLLYYNNTDIHSYTKGWSPLFAQHNHLYHNQNVKIRQSGHDKTYVYYISQQIEDQVISGSTHADQVINPLEGSNASWSQMVRHMVTMHPLHTDDGPSVNKSAYLAKGWSTFCADLEDFCSFINRLYCCCFKEAMATAALYMERSKLSVVSTISI